MVRKTFDIKDEVILKQLDIQVNQTQYIISLVKKDLENTKELNRDMIIKVIEDYLEKKNGNIKRDNEVKNSVKGILKMLK